MSDATNRYKDVDNSSSDAPARRSMLNSEIDTAMDTESTSVGNMKRTRIVVALSVAICATTPLVGLAHLSRDIRHLDFFDTAFRDTDMPFPWISSVMLPFGPLDWWSYLAPAALSVAVAASLRSPVPNFGLVLILGSSIAQSLVMVAVAGPYVALTKVMGHFPTTPYPNGPLVANLALLAASIGLAGFSLRRLR